MSVSCETSATATLYSNRISYETYTQFQTQTNNGTELVTSTVQTATRTAAIPTSTLYDTVCETLVVASDTSGQQTTVADSDASTSTKLRPTATATLVSASTQAGDGSVVYVTSYSTMSATSVFIVVKTDTPSPAIASNTVSADSDTKSSSSSHAGPIAGGIVAAVILLALLGGLAWFIRKRSRRDRDTRALDDFFKDALNPGDANSGLGVEAATLGGGAGTLSSRRNTKRKSSLMLDLEKEKDLSHSNDEDNWAALTRMSSLADDDNRDMYRRLSQSRQSLNAVSRAVSMHSIGPEAVLIGATGWDGTSEKHEMVEEPESFLDRANSRKSSASLFNGPQISPMSPNDVNRASRVRHLSSRSNELLPRLSPGIYSLPSSPEHTPLVLHSPVEEGMPTFAANNNMNLHQGYEEGNHHMSISSVYAPPLGSTAIQKQRSFSSSSQQMPERPKSALAIMAVSSQQQQPQQHPHQWSPPSSPRHPSYTAPMNSPGSVGRIQQRASVHGYNQCGPYTNWSPPLAPQRIHSSNRPRPAMSTHYSGSGGDYPPSRYSHLDIVKQAIESEAEGEEQAKPIVEGGRQRSLSGSLLVKSPIVEPEIRKAADVSPPSSTSTSKKNSLSIRNANSEPSTGGEGEDEVEEQAPVSMQAYHEKMVKNVSEKAQALFGYYRS